MTLGGSVPVFQGLKVGITDGTTVTQGTQNTTGTQTKVTYTASTAATSTKTTQISGTFGDDHDFDTPTCQQELGKCYNLRVSVYVDELFGSYMFSDPDAPKNPFEGVTGPIQIHLPPEPVPMEEPRTTTTKASIAPVVSPVISPEFRL